jgi:hypothetical protein
VDGLRGVSSTFTDDLKRFRRFYMKTASIEQLVIRFAGGMILVSLLLATLHSMHWLWFTALVGANLLQTSFTGFCPLAKILKAIGVQPGTAFK